jgi:hypothetical protein
VSQAIEPPRADPVGSRGAACRTGLRTHLVRCGDSRLRGDTVRLSADPVELPAGGKGRLRNWRGVEISRGAVRPGDDVVGGAWQLGNWQMSLSRTFGAMRHGRVAKRFVRPRMSTLPPQPST